MAGASCTDDAGDEGARSKAPDLDVEQPSCSGTGGGTMSCPSDVANTKLVTTARAAGWVASGGIGPEPPASAAVGGAWDPKSMGGDLRGQLL